jgi:DNA-binding protein H-NS
MSALYARDDARAKVILRRYARDARYRRYRDSIQYSLNDGNEVEAAEEVVENTSRRRGRQAAPRNLEEYVRQNGTLRGVPCNFLLR